jgi:hypothetical protein
VAMLTPLDLGVVENFCEWRICLRVSEKGRRLRGIKSSASLNTFWKTFCLVYKWQVGKAMCPEMIENMIPVWPTAERTKIDTDVN